MGRIVGAWQAVLGAGRDDGAGQSDQGAFLLFGERAVGSDGIHVNVLEGNGGSVK